MKTETITWKSSIKGWLFLPALSFLVTPVKFVYVLCMALLNVHSLHGINIAILIGDTVLLAFISYLAYFFFRCHKHAPVLYIILRLVFVVFITAIYVKSTHYMLTRESSFELFLEFFGGIAGCLLLIPYFVYSKRVKQTFINEGNQDKPLDRSLETLCPFLQKFQDFLERVRKFIIPLVFGFIILQFMVIIVIYAFV